MSNELIVVLSIVYFILAVCYVINLNDLKDGLKPDGKVFFIISFVLWPISMISQAYTYLLHGGD